MLTRLLFASAPPGCVWGARYENLVEDWEEGTERWRQWFDMAAPEEGRLPQDWNARGPARRLCVTRALRPDRTARAAATYVRTVLGVRYIGEAPPGLAEAASRAPAAHMPVFIAAAPGGPGSSDPVTAVEAVAAATGRTRANQRLAVVSMGHGCEPVADAALDQLLPTGGWVLLQVGVNSAPCPFPAP